MIKIVYSNFFCPTSKDILDNLDNDIDVLVLTYCADNIDFKITNLPLSLKYILISNLERKCSGEKISEMIKLPYGCQIIFFDYLEKSADETKHYFVNPMTIYDFYGISNKELINYITGNDHNIIIKQNFFKETEVYFSYNVTKKKLDFVVEKNHLK
jgi:hypothetical protein